MKQAYLTDMFKKAPKLVCTAAAGVSPDPLYYSINSFSYED
jgi:hypothetical protein